MRPFSEMLHLKLNSSMSYNYFHIRYFETKNGKDYKTQSAYYCTLNPSTIDSLKYFLQNTVLKNPKALVTIFSLQPLERETYLSKGGIAPAE